ncbi:unnamed protein product [Amoebophrya sp. A120]|nr:unnamed protein product [Amoebophrya sp. A120]|eukprot:GSA120T00004878001.1
MEPGSELRARRRGLRDISNTPSVPGIQTPLHGKSSQFDTPAKKRPRIAAGTPGPSYNVQPMRNDNLKSGFAKKPPVAADPVLPQQPGRRALGTPGPSYNTNIQKNNTNNVAAATASMNQPYPAPHDNLSKNRADQQQGQQLQQPPASFQPRLQEPVVPVVPSSSSFSKLVAAKQAENPFCITTGSSSQIRQPLQSGVAPFLHTNTNSTSGAGLSFADRLVQQREAQKSARGANPATPPRNSNKVFAKIDEPQRKPGTPGPSYRCASPGGKVKAGSGTPAFGNRGGTQPTLRDRVIAVASGTKLESKVDVWKTSSSSDFRFAPDQSNAVRFAPSSAGFPGLAPAPGKTTAAAAVQPHEKRPVNHVVAQEVPGLLAHHTPGRYAGLVEHPHPGLALQPQQLVLPKRHEQRNIGAASGLVQSAKEQVPEPRHKNSRAAGPGGPAAAPTSSTPFSPFSAVQEVEEPVFTFSSEEDEDEVKLRNTGRAYEGTGSKKYMKAMKTTDMQRSVHFANTFESKEFLVQEEEPLFADDGDIKDGPIQTFTDNRTEDEKREAALGRPLIPAVDLTGLEKRRLSQVLGKLFPNDPASPDFAFQSPVGRTHKKSRSSAAHPQGGEAVRRPGEMNLFLASNGHQQSLQIPSPRFIDDDGEEENFANLNFERSPALF